MTFTPNQRGILNLLDIGLLDIIINLFNIALPHVIDKIMEVLITRNNKQAISLEMFVMKLQVAMLCEWSFWPFLRRP